MSDDENDTVAVMNLDSTLERAAAASEAAPAAKAAAAAVNEASAAAAAGESGRGRPSIAVSVPGAAMRGGQQTPQPSTKPPPAAVITIGSDDES